VPTLYLLGCLALMAACLLGWLFRPAQRRLILLSGLMLAPFGLLGHVFVPEYWSPQHALTLLPGVGVEDFLFCFACGGLAWALATWSPTWKVRCRVCANRLVVRYLTAAAMGLALAGGCRLAGLGIMPAAIAGFGVVGALLALGWRGRWRLALAGGLGFAFVYVLCLGMMLAIYPEVLSWWRDGPQGAEAVVLGEGAWALSFGAAWPVLVAYAADARVVRKKRDYN
jgi:hypothetical protein